MSKPTVCQKCQNFYNICLTPKLTNEDVIVVGGSPTIFAVSDNRPFQSADERLIKTIFTGLQRDNAEFRSLRIGYTYAIRTATQNNLAANICKTFLQRDIINVTLQRGNKPPVIVALGEIPLRALDYKVKKISSLYSRVIEITLPTSTPESVLKLTTFVMPSIDFLARNPGLLQTVKGIARLALTAVNAKQKIVGTPQTEYYFPKTIEDVKNVVDTIINYYNPERTKRGPEYWLISLDLETNGLHPYWLADPKIYMLSVAWDEGKAATIMLDHPETPYDPKQAWEHVDRLLQCPKPKTFHNFKFDLKFLELVYKKPVNNVSWDTMLGEHYIDENKKGFYGLKKLVPLYVPQFQNYEENIRFDVAEETSVETTKKFTKRKLIDYIEKIIADGIPAHDTSIATWKQMLEALKKSKGAIPATLRQQLKLLNIEISGPAAKTQKPTPISEIQKYATIDADVTRRIARKQKLFIAATHIDTYATQVMEKLYLPASRVLGEMEYVGTKLDREKLNNLIKEVASKIEEIERHIKIHYNPNLNIRSQQQLASWIAQLNLPAVKENSADKEVFQTYLDLLPQNDPRRDFCVQILNFRSLHKLLFTYLIPLRDFAAKDGRIHCAFHLNGTATGRLSSSDPNMQNIPKIAGVRHAPDGSVLHPGYNIKELFIPSSPDLVMVNVDIKAAELRVYTAYAEDPLMIDLFMTNKDPHSWVTAQVYKKTYEEINAVKETDPQVKKLRDQCKRIVFGTLYGAGPERISKILDINIDEARNLQRKIFEVLPALPRYVETTKEKIFKEKQLRTLFGRFRRFPQLHYDNSFSAMAIREGVNFLIQSTSSDLVLTRICALDKPIKKLGGRLLLTVHDSVVMEVPRSKISELKPLLNEIIVEQIKKEYPWLPVPFLFDVEMGESYGKTEKF